MKFSIIIPTYKRHPLLKNLIQCIQKQTYPEYEVFICSDGHDKDVQNMVLLLDERFHYTYIENKGKQFGHRQRNYIIDRVTGDYVLWIDDDNIIYKNYLEMAKNNIQKNTGIVIHKIIHELGVLPKKKDIIFADIDTLNFIVKTEIAQKVKWKEDLYEADYYFIKECQEICIKENLKVVYSDKLIGEHVNSQKSIYTRQKS